MMSGPGRAGVLAFAAQDRQAHLAGFGDNDIVGHFRALEGTPRQYGVASVIFDQKDLRVPRAFGNLGSSSISSPSVHP